MPAAVVPEALPQLAILPLRLVAVLTAAVAITIATLTALVAEFSFRRQRPLPLYGWVGVALLAAFEALLFQGNRFVATYFTPLVWTAYLLVVDAAVVGLRGYSRLTTGPGKFLRLAGASILLWLTFELYNLRLQNWVYTGIPQNRAAALAGFAWAFATIWPALFETADLIEAFGWLGPCRPLRLSHRAERTLCATGAVLLLLPLLVPRWLARDLFGMVWIGFAFLLDPIDRWRGWPSLLEDLRQGKPQRLGSLLVAGWICGWLWEFWNYWAGAKWHYTFPILQNWKLFEMPLPGYLGFPAFAVEAFAMYSFLSGWWGWETGKSRGA